MRVLLVSEASGVHHNLKRGLESLGHEAILVMTVPRTFQGRQADIYFDSSRENFVSNLRGKMRDAVWPAVSLRRLPPADVANFVLGLSLFEHGRNRYRDLPLLRRAGGAVSYYGLGCDEISLLRVRPDRADSPCPTCEAFDELGRSCRQRILSQRGRARLWREQIDFIVSSTYEFAHCHEFHPTAAHAQIPLPVAVGAIEFFGIDRHKVRPLIVHAPTRRGFKGTREVLQAVAFARAIGVDFDFELIEGLTHRQWLRSMERADIFIDQVFSEGYGMAAAECLAMGKVVMSGLGHHARSYFPFTSDCPIIDAPPDPRRLAAAIAATLEQREAFGPLAERGRAYVAAHHDCVGVAAQFADLWTDKTTAAVGQPPYPLQSERSRSR